MRPPRFYICLREEEPTPPPLPKSWASFKRPHCSPGVKPPSRLGVGRWAPLPPHWRAPEAASPLLGCQALPSRRFLPSVPGKGRRARRSSRPRPRAAHARICVTRPRVGGRSRSRRGARTESPHVTARGRGPVDAQAEEKERRRRRRRWQRQRWRRRRLLLLLPPPPERQPFPRYGLAGQSEA